MRRTPIVAAAALALGLAGCGSSTSSAIAHDAQAHYASKDARCRKAGLMLFVGKRTAVYDCKLIGVDPAHRPAEQLQSHDLDRCFVRADGNTYEVTEQVTALQQISSGGFRCH